MMGSRGSRIGIFGSGLLGERVAVALGGASGCGVDRAVEKVIGIHVLVIFIN